ncbi:MAG: DoxX family protein [Flavisolibacter sp.]
MAVSCLLPVAEKYWDGFDGMGMDATIQAFQSYMGLSAFWTYLSSYTELIGGLFLILGFFTRPLALAVMINMLVASVFIGFKGFFVEKGAAYPFSLMVSALVILLIGPLSYSVDAILSGRTNRSLNQQLHNNR